MARARDALHGFGNGLRAFQDGMNQFAQATRQMGMALKSIGKISKKFTTDATRAHYNLAGHYTFPLEQEVLDQQPPKPSDLNLLGQATLCVIPVIPVTLLLSVTVIPLVGNTLQSLPRGFVNVYNLGGLGNAPDEEVLIPYPPEQRNWLRRIYGSPGYLLGAIAGAPMTLIPLALRIVAHTIASSIEIFDLMFNFAAAQEVFFFELARSTTNRVLGMFGIPLGAIAGVIGMLGVYLCRILINSFKSLAYSFLKIFNYALPYTIHHQLPLPEYDRSITSKLFGIPGLILGVALGGISALLLTSAITTYRVFVNSLNTALPFEIATAPDQRRLPAVIVGFIPGLLIGGIFGEISALAILLGRIVINTAVSFGRYFSHGLSLGLPQALVISADLRTPGSKKLGVLGALFGALAGFITGCLASTAISLFGSFCTVTNLALHTNDKIKLGSDTRSLLGKVMGSPGLFLGASLGIVGALTVCLVRSFINGGKSWLYGFKYCLNMGLPELMRFENEDTRDSNTKKFGYLGLLFGGCIGIISACLASSAISAFRRFCSVSNFALHKNDAIDLYPDTRSLFGRRLGKIGSLLGASAGLFSALTIALGRILINSGISWVHAFRNTLNLGLLESARLPIHEDNRHPTTQKLGLPGLLFGGTLGLITAIFASTAITTAGVWTTLVNLALDEKFVVGNDTRGTLGQILGSLGFIIGGITGALSAAIIGSRKLFGNGKFSFMLFFKRAINLSLPENKKLATAEDNRSLFRQISGFITGGITGILLGGTVAFFISSALSVASAFKLTTNFVLENEFDTTDTRGKTGKFFGGLGFLLGGVTGLLGAFTLVCVRLLKNSIMSFLVAFTSMLIIALPSAYYFKIDDQRTLTNKIFGIPGLVLGAILGSVTAFFVSTALTTMNVFKRVTNFVLENEFDVEDTRSLNGKILGGLGWILGSVTGLLSAFTIAMARFIKNSAISFLLGFKKTLNVGLPSNYCLNTADNRNLSNESFGLLGLVLGGFLGTVTACVASTGITTGRTCVNIINLVLDENYDIHMPRDTRPTLGKLFGVLGLIPGTIAGIIGAIFAGSVRILLNTGITALRFMRIVSNFGLPGDQLFDVAADGRTNNAKVLGGFGIVIGCVFGAIGAIFISSLQTLARTSALTFNLPWQAIQIPLAADERSRTGKILGVLALPAGVVLGLGAALIPALARMFYQGFFLGAISFIFLTNVALHPDDRFWMEPYQSNWADKCYGAPGFILGGVLGLCGAALVTIGRYISQTCQSWFYFSGSLMNCGLGWRLFEGLSIDRRSWQAKAVGGLGYVFALPTTLPLALTIFAFRQTPLVASVMLGFTLSPIIFLVRGALNLKKHWDNYDRFAQPQLVGELNIHDRQSVIQGFKNIYSSLNVWGNFTPGEGNYIAYDADGKKNRWTFFRKCVTFNTDSVTERTLNELLKAYKLYAANDDREGGFGAGFFDSADFTKVVDDLKDYYANGCCDSAKEIAELHIEIKNISDFVKTYMKDRINEPNVEIQDMGPPGGLPFRILFFGENQVAPLVAVPGGPNVPNIEEQGEQPAQEHLHSPAA